MTDSSKTSDSHQQDVLEGVDTLCADRKDRSVSPNKSSPLRWWKWPLRLLICLVVVLALVLTGLRYGGIPLAIWQLDRWYQKQSPSTEYDYRVILGD